MDEIPFPRLFDGVESLGAVRARWEAYNRLWDEQERRTNVSGRLKGAETGRKGIVSELSG